MGITTFYLPIRFIIGEGTLAKLGVEASRLGKLALLVTGSKSMKSTGVLDKVIKDLDEHGVKAIIFDKVEPNPRASTIDSGARLARENKVQLVIGLGGGSSMDSAKLIALASGCGIDSIFDCYQGKTPAKGQALPIILVPTIAATGSEANNGAVFTDWDTHEKVVYFSGAIFPAVSIVDPALTLTLPSRTTAQGGVDMFCHLCEPYITAAEHGPINDALRESCMRTVVESLPRVLKTPEDIELRSRISWACTLAMSQFVLLGGIGPGVFPVHGMEHSLSGVYDIAHGDGLAALLIEWMKFTQPVRKERFEQLGKNVFGESDGIAATAKWLKSIGMDIGLQELGVKETDFDKLADNALKTAPWVKLNPIPLDKTSIAAMYKKSY
jgi:alcohol dehydrogenase YqhD (iron-dependent ADH family)